jgi:hypothetical protein
MVKFKESYDRSIDERNDAVKKWEVLYSYGEEFRIAGNAP